MKYLGTKKIKEFFNVGSGECVFLGMNRKTCTTSSSSPGKQSININSPVIRRQQQAPHFPALNFRRSWKKAREIGG
jgi:hypothetical protein